MRFFFSYPVTVDGDRTVDVDAVTPELVSAMMADGLRATLARIEANPADASLWMRAGYQAEQGAAQMLLVQAEAR